MPVEKQGLWVRQPDISGIPEYPRGKTRAPGTREAQKKIPSVGIKRTGSQIVRKTL